MQRREHSGPSLLLALAALFVFGTAWSPAAGLPGPRVLSGIVVRVVDGDTIHVRVEGRLEKVRYTGVNTPEMHHPTKGEQPGGREAANVNRRLVAGKTVQLK